MSARTQRRREPPSERTIDSPDRRTLLMLFAVFAVTFGSWGAARFRCNLHPPQSKAPPELPTERLAAEPKGAAIELQQRWSTYDFAGALELADDEVARQLREEREACETAQRQCRKDRSEAVGNVWTKGQVVESGADRAKARVTTVWRSGESKSYLLELRREGPLWKAVSRKPES